MNLMFLQLHTAVNVLVRLVSPKTKAPIAVRLILSTAAPFTMKWQHQKIHLFFISRENVLQHRFYGWCVLLADCGVRGRVKLTPEHTADSHPGLTTGRAALSGNLHWARFAIASYSFAPAFSRWETQRVALPQKALRVTPLRTFQNHGAGTEQPMTEGNLLGVIYCTHWIGCSFWVKFCSWSSVWCFNGLMISDFL